MLAGPLYWGAYDGIVGNDVVVVHVPSEDDKTPADNLMTANHEIGRADHRNYCDGYNSVVTQIGEVTGIGAAESV